MCAPRSSRFLRAEFKPAAIWATDPRIRELEELAPPAPGPLFASEKGAETATEFYAQRLHFRYDAASGQKTGAFLDQRLNYVAAARYAKGRAGAAAKRALDVLHLSGGFALHLARVCETRHRRGRLPRRP